MLDKKCSTIDHRFHFDKSQARLRCNEETVALLRLQKITNRRKRAK